MSIAVPLQTVFANTRNGTATYAQADGAVATQTALNSRTNHFISGGPGALFEPSRTNSFTNSGDMGGSGWYGFRTTYSQGDAAPISGQYFLNCEANATNSNGSAVANQVVSSLPAGTYTQSVFVKIGPTDPGFLLIRPTDNSNFNNMARAWFDIAGGTAETVDSLGTNFTNATSGIQSIGGGVYRCWITFTTNATLSISARYYVVDADAGLPTTIGKDIQVWGAQFETGAFPTTYIPTSTVAVTRLADRASCSLSDIGFDAAGGSIFIEGRAYYTTGGSGFPRIFQIDDGTLSNRVQLTINEAANTVNFSVTSGGVSQASEEVAYTSGAYFKAGIRYVGNNCVLSLGGVDSGADTTVTMPSGLTTLNWQADHVGANNGAAVFITKFATYAKEFADATLNTETA
jgi:hypothetical protein